MTGLYGRIAERDEGQIALARARLRYAALSVMHKALDASSLSQSDLARRLRIRRSAVNQVFRGDGNVQVSTLAEYLYAMGFELNLDLVHAGEPRHAALEDRPIVPAFSSTNVVTKFTVITEGEEGTPVIMNWGVRTLRAEPLRMHLWRTALNQPGEEAAPDFFWYPSTRWSSTAQTPEDTSTGLDLIGQGASA